MRLVGLCGSLRSESSNLWVLRAVAQLLPAGASFEIYDGMGALPHFNPELDGDSPPATVSLLRQTVAQGDGLVISCPEYAHGVPGSFKNLLDWLVSSVDFPGKPVLILNASPHSHHAQDSLAETLKTMSANLVCPPYETLRFYGRPNSVEFVLTDAPVRKQLEAALASLVKVIRASRMEGS